MTDIEKNCAIFDETVTKVVQREGALNLLTWLHQTDFFDAPASTRYHSAVKGGLLAHSLAVYNRLREIIVEAGHLFGYTLNDVTEETIAVVGLFHDVCKVNSYKTEMRWRKDANDKWEQYATYRKEEDFPFGGHGSKSVFLVQSFIKLTFEEASAINCHMGGFDTSTYNNPSAVYEQNPLAWLLHVADEAATYIDKT